MRYCFRVYLAIRLISRKLLNEETFFEITIAIELLVAFDVTSE